MHKTNKTTAPFDSTYNKFVHEISEIRESTFFCQGVWVVAVFIHHTVRLHSSRTLEEGGHHLLQTIPGCKVKQRGKLQVTLICTEINR